MEKFEKLKTLLQTAEKDAAKFYLNGNAAAGTRLRKFMQDTKVLAQDIRNEVSEIKSKS
ncbi:histone H1 [Chitinophaga japonensis]|uniref:Histone H1-like protein Hc1 n=1 Tax=Chitinophaga japonensis TaxID=104662 RepID=A0A562T2B3_CHIJA|nr:histone H1 [Chitinophaga japonensis]TWI87809.1 hypothetical protein LX66_1880 [Chitinophaga japonensis]